MKKIAGSFFLHIQTKHEGAAMCERPLDRKDLLEMTFNRSNIDVPEWLLRPRKIKLPRRKKRHRALVYIPEKQ